MLENMYPISLMDEIRTYKICFMLILSFALILNVMMTKKTKPLYICMILLRHVWDNHRRAKNYFSTSNLFYKKIIHLHYVNDLQ